MAREPCGCSFDVDLGVRHCPLHKAAEEMLVTLETTVAFLESLQKTAQAVIERAGGSRRPLTQRGRIRMFLESNPGANLAEIAKATGYTKERVRQTIARFNAEKRAQGG